LAEQEAAKWVSAAAWSSAFELTALIDGRKLLLAELPPPPTKPGLKPNSRNKQPPPRVCSWRPPGEMQIRLYQSQLMDVFIVVYILNQGCQFGRQRSGGARASCAAAQPRVAPLGSR